MKKTNAVCLYDFSIILSYLTIFNGIMNKYLRLNTPFIILISKEKYHAECLSYPLRLKLMDQETRASNYAMKLISLMKPFNISESMSSLRTMKSKDPQIRLLFTYPSSCLTCSSWQKICKSKLTQKRLTQCKETISWSCIGSSSPSKGER